MDYLAGGPGAFRNCPLPRKGEIRAGRRGLYRTTILLLSLISTKGMITFFA
jgi:hypothetical protein